MSTIVVPFELGSPSLDVARQAALVARHFRADVVVLRVSEDHPPDLAAVHEALAGLAVRDVVRRGDPAQAILDVARDEKATLIAMYPHAYETFYPYYLSPAATRVLHESECPVWTSAHLGRSKGELAVRHVLCALDFGPSTDRTLKHATELATAFGARLTLVHVTPNVEMYGPGGLHVEPAWQKPLVDEALHRLGETARTLSMPAETFVASRDDVPKALGDVAERVAADVLVIGGRKSGGELHTNAYGIVCRSRLPVLSV